MKKAAHVAALCLVACCAGAQEFELPSASATDAATLSRTVPALATQIMAAYKEGDRAKYLDNLFRLQIVTGRYDDALNSLASSRKLLALDHPERASWVNVQYEMYIRAKMLEAAEKLPFNDAYARIFHNTFSRLDDKTSALLIRELIYEDPGDAERDVQSDLEKQKGKNDLSLPDAIKLVADYQVEESYRSFAPLIPNLIAEDDARRYVTEKDVRVKTRDGATLCALLMRPLGHKPLPTLLKFTIYVDPNDNPNDARQSASNGYVGVVAFTRGKACSPDQPIPYLHDGPDAAAVIDWISTQPWSDGRVGMYGGSYEGFTQWATAKYMPKGLKAIMAGAPAAPGIDVPMEGSVFANFIYPWPFYTTDKRDADDAVYSNSARWQKLNHDWYVSGRAYRDLDKIDGTPNPIFDQWISHPSYDAYWQKMIPYGQEFAKINIPVLQTAGYYSGGPGAAVYYFSQHHKYDPQAEHILLIGPYDHIGAQFGVIGLLGNVYDSLSGLDLDPVAKIDLTELRYQWFDYIFRGSPKPAILADKVNYEVTGANLWKHAPSLSAMARGTLRFHLSPARSGNAYRLTPESSSRDFVDLKVDLADRSDVDRTAPGGGVVDTAIDTWNGLEFVSDPLPKATELSGLFSGQLDFVCNKKDFDFEIDLYQQTPQGQYIQLTSYWTRASYARDRSHRRLLKSAKRQRLNFQSVRLMSRQLQMGSRLVAVLSVIKNPEKQINYGAGKDVSDETIADASPHLAIRWFADSYIAFPVGR